MIRFVALALPLLMLMLALFGFAVELLDLEPRAGSVIRLALFEQPRVPATVVLSAWLMEACGLLALFLVAQGRFAVWWLDGLVAGWLAWIFRGPLLVLTIVVATRQPQDPWWTLAFGWWLLYSACGLAMAHLARRSGLNERKAQDDGSADRESEPEPTEPAAPEEGTQDEPGAGTEAEAAPQAAAPADDTGEDPELRPEGRDGAVDELGAANATTKPEAGVDPKQAPPGDAPPTSEAAEPGRPSGSGA